MKNIYSSALRYSKKNSPFINLESPAFIISLLIIIGFFFASCQKEMDNTPASATESISSIASTNEATVLSNYNGISVQTMLELQQARAASARYRKFDNAIKDGYVDINVIVPEMGYHFLKMDNLDIKFDHRKPEILVYNKDHDGNMELVAIEYAVPIELTPNTAPAGFTGNADVWDKNANFGLWLLHAWVWSYNPNGVFNPTNPLVHLH